MAMRDPAPEFFCSLVTEPEDGLVTDPEGGAGA